MSRWVDRGAITAGWVGVGMAMTIAVSFLLVVPIEPVFWLMAPFAGLIIGYYANSRAGRLDRFGRILANGLYAGALTAVTMALLFVGTKAIFFFADDGYRDAASGGPVACVSGADCVYQRYLVQGKGSDFAKAGVTDTGSFTAFYWREQFGTAGTVLALCTIGGLAGAFVYGLVRPKPNRSTDAPAPGPTGPGASAAEPITGPAQPGAWTRAALTSAGLGHLEFAASDLLDGRAAMQAVVVPGESAFAVWSALRDGHPPGWWPLILGGPDELARLRHACALDGPPASGILAVAAGSDPDDVVASRVAAADADPGKAAEVGPWPTEPVAPMLFVLPFDVLTGRPRPTVVAVVEVEDPTTLPAVFGWGDWNDCPAPDVHVVFARRWAERYGAEFVGLSADMLEMRVTRPPAGRDDATALALEMHGYCPDLVEQGTETLSNLAATVLGSGVWSFWWD